MSENDTPPIPGINPDGSVILDKGHGDKRPTPEVMEQIRKQVAKIRPTRERTP